MEASVEMALFSAHSGSSFLYLLQGAEKKESESASGRGTVTLGEVLLDLNSGLVPDLMRL